MGFTTIALHHPAGREDFYVRGLVRKLDSAVSLGWIETFLETPKRSAFGILAPAGSAPGRSN